MQGDKIVDESICLTLQDLSKSKKNLDSSFVETIYLKEFPKVPQTGNRV